MTVVTVIIFIKVMMSMMVFIWQNYTHHDCILVFSIKWGEFPDAHLETSGTDILQPNINCIIGLCGSSVLRREKNKGCCSKVLKYSHIFVRLTKKHNFQTVDQAFLGEKPMSPHLFKGYYVALGFCCPHFTKRQAARCNLWLILESHPVYGSSSI